MTNIIQHPASPLRTARKALTRIRLACQLTQQERRLQESCAHLVGGGKDDALVIILTKSKEMVAASTNALTACDYREEK